MEHGTLSDGAHQAVTLPAVNRRNRTGDPVLEQEMPAVSAAQRLTSIAGVLWLCGVGTMMVFHLIQLLRLHSRLTGTVPLRGNVYLADHIPTPFVLGLFRPRIYLPSGVSERERPYIIRHETQPHPQGRPHHQAAGLRGAVPALVQSPGLAGIQTVRQRYGDVL